MAQANRYLNSDMNDKVRAESASPQTTLGAAIERLEQATHGRETAEWALARANTAACGEADLAEQCLAIASVMLLALDTEGRVTLVNPRGLDTLGYEREQDVIGKNWFEHFLPTAVRGQVTELFQQLVRGASESAGHYENPIIRRDGVERVIVWHNSILHDRSGRITGVLCSGQDVTQARRTEAALRARERQQAAIATLGQQALGSFNLQTLLDAAVTVVAEVLGLAYSKVLERLPGGEDFLLRAGVGWRPGLVGRAIVPGRSSQAGFTLQSPEPVIIEDLSVETRFHGPALLLEHGVFSGLSCAITAPDGRPWGVLGAHASERRTFSRDDMNFLVAVANILAAVIARTEATQALHEREADLRRAQTIGHIGSWRLDVQTNEITWSEENHRIFGVPLGTPMTYEGFLAVIHPDDRDYVDQMWQAGLHGMPYDIEHRILAGGTIKWVRERAELEFAEDGTLLGGFGTTQDITERKRTEEALREADRRKDEFLATLGHELRNPLAPLRSACDVLRLADLPDPNAQAARDIIDRQVSHCVRLVDDLLDVSRITRGKLHIRRKHVALAEVLGQAVEVARPLIERAGQVLTISQPPEPIHLHGDSVRLAQVFSNLLNNACKYTPSGGRIDLVVEPAEGEVIVKVVDSGIGIPPEHLSRLFEMFHQVPAAPEQVQSGLGIGLSLVEGLVRMHGGRVAVTSIGPGQGSTFTVWLPAEPVSPGVGAARAEHSSGRGAPVASARILVVDDNADVAGSLALMLRLHGHEVQTAHDGLEAVEVGERFQPELVLLDLGMPRLDGYGACRRLRELPWGKDLKIVALTGWGQESDREKTEEAGFDAHWTKPVAASAVLDFIAGTRAGRA